MAVLKKLSSKKVVKKNPVKKTRRLAPFIAKFNKRNYSKLARDYHHEVLHLILDLLNINRKIDRANALCQHELELLSGRKSDLLDPSFSRNFEEVLYHIENFAFRASAFREKLTQFINQALLLGYGERERDLMGKMAVNRITTEAHIDTEVKKFNTNTEMKAILSKRVSLSHLRYYNPETGYSPYLYPDEEKHPKDLRDFIKRWRKNVDKEAKQANRFVKLAQEVSNKTMIKINTYWEKHPRH